MKHALIPTGCLLLALAARAENWPQFRGPTGQGISTETDLPMSWNASSNVAWKTPIPGESWSSPIVWGDRVFVTTTDASSKLLRLASLEARTGKLLWLKDVLAQDPIRKDDGNSFATSTPATDGERVYVVSFNGAFAAVDFNGAIVWTNLATTFYVKHGLAGSLALHDNLILLNCDATSSGPDRFLGWQKAWDGAYVLAVDKRTGQVKWKSSRGMTRVAFATPIVVKVGERDQVISTAGDIIEGFDFETGERVWTAISHGEGVVPSPVVGDGLVFSPSAFNTGTPDSPTAIRAFRLGGNGDVTKSHFAWEHTQSVSKVPSFVYSRPWLFTVDETGVVQCLKGDTGEVLWKNRVGGGQVGASLVLAEGHIYLLNEKGETTILEAGPRFEVLAKNPLAERCKASMAVSGGRLFLRGQDNVYCISK